MEATIDGAGRVVIPKSLRDQLGLRPGPVDIVLDGAAIRIEPRTSDQLVRVHGRPVIPPSGEPLDDDDVRELRRADQR